MIRFNSRNHPELSNFHHTFKQVELRIEGRSYYFDSAEAAFHALKQKPYRDEEILPFTVMNPNAARYAGKRVKLRDDWHEVRVPLMAHILKAKFQSPYLRSMLLATGGEPLVHEAPWDAFWGNGKNGNGTNMLGILLMDLRGQLKG